ncbi:metal ABC transporter solute-binding protein, Zn/Mn family [Paenibacillus tarimensis]|uniref:metal ABC transporter solute-binding protein, Zn/Mn family n=1 Tax=Paenibacillus tarimensis TaxID=416012 RepID=UPI0038B3C0DD
MKKAPFKRWVVTMAYVLLAAVLLSGCGNGERGAGVEGSEVLKVASTTGMIHDIVREIGGSDVEAVGLMGPGTDPHLYKASQGDIRRLDEADVIFYNGLHLEGTMAEMLEKLAEKKRTVAVASRLTEGQLLTVSEEDGQAYDPHVWFDVKNWISAAEVVRDTLKEADAAHADSYDSRADDYIKRLEELDRYAVEQIAAIPESGRVLVTAHDAFGYFGRAYDMEVMGLQGISTASEYGSKDVSNLRDYLVEHKIKAVFVESSVPKRAIEAVIEGARKLGHEVKIGGELYSDAMGEEGTEAGTYIGMVRHNVDTIVEALQ